MFDHLLPFYTVGSSKTIEEYDFFAERSRLATIVDAGWEIRYTAGRHVRNATVNSQTIQAKVSGDVRLFHANSLIKSTLQSKEELPTLAQTLTMTPVIYNELMQWPKTLKTVNDKYSRRFKTLRSYKPTTDDCNFRDGEEGKFPICMLLPTMDINYDEDAVNTVTKTDWSTIQQGATANVMYNKHREIYPAHLIWFHKQSGDSQSANTPRVEEVDIEMHKWLTVKFELYDYRQNFHDVNPMNRNTEPLPDVTNLEQAQGYQYDVSGSFNVY